MVLLILAALAAFIILRNKDKIDLSSLQFLNVKTSTINRDTLFKPRFDPDNTPKFPT